MPSLRFALDEDVAHRLASLLRSRGLDADSAKELGRLGLSDAQVLLRAAVGRQIVVTHKSQDFRALHEAWVTWRRRWTREVEQLVGSPVSLSPHAGILVMPHLPIHDRARILEEFEGRVESLDDRLFAWSVARDWHELHVEQPMR